MRGSAEPAPAVSFLEAPAGRRLFAVLYEDPAAPRRRPVLYLPPFAEEMNRTRRMAALAARALAAAGHATLIVDPTGTGDSSGDFAAATWPLWAEDFDFAARWFAARQGEPAVLLAARSGALLAPPLMASGAAAGDMLALWQPVTSGKQFFTQFLRLKLAADMAEGAEAGGTKALRESLAAGESVEIAGYEIHPELARGLEAASLDTAALAGVRRLAWLESGASALPEKTPALLPASVRLIEALRTGGAEIHAAAFAEPPYWVTPETTLAPGVIAASSAFFAAGQA
jgi:exosortase A-associated hydrolase 2